MDKVRKSTPKKQHYVPQFLLKNFSYGKKSRLYAFDKKRAISFPTNVKDVACEKGFYNLSIESEQYTLEHKLSELESECSCVIKKIIKEESIDSITIDERFMVCVFVSNLFLRVKRQRLAWEQIHEGFMEIINGGNIDSTKTTSIDDFLKGEISKNHIDFTQNNVLYFARVIEGKCIALLKAPKGKRFVISDNPVAVYNNLPRPNRGNRGLALEGVEVHVPISSKLSLSFMCPKLFSEIESKIDLFLSETGISQISKSDINYAVSLVSGVRKGCPVEIQEKNVDACNSLQIADSWRYIYSPKNDFYLAKRLLREHPRIAETNFITFGS